MILWLAVVFFGIGIACLAIDRKALAYFRAHTWHHWQFAYNTTNFVKGGTWIVMSILVYAATQLLLLWRPADFALKQLSDIALALVISFVAASIFLHSTKLILGRRRPTDEVQHELYGLKPFAFDTRYDSFPSGHAMTAFCIAVVFSAAVPMLAILWFVLAIYFAMTRALLSAHFLSDVWIGAAVGTLIARQTIILAFPAYAPGWF